MKVDPDKSPIAGFGGLLDAESFTPSLPTRAILQAAYADPGAELLASEDVLTRNLVATGVRAFRYVGARVGVEVGIPVGVLDAFAESLSIAGQDQAVTKWREIIEHSQSALVDAAMDAIGAVPIVGWICKAGFALVQGIMAAALKEKPKPPLIEYNEDLDRPQAVERLKQLAALDWTFMFLPAYRTEKWSDWDITALQTGFLMRPRESIPTNGGAIPGGPLGSRGVQSRNCWYPQLGGVGGKLSPYKSQEAYYVANIERAASCILDLWETTPSVARVSLSAWQQMTARQVPTLWAVDTRGIVSAWESFVETGLEFSKIGLNMQKHGGDPWRWVAFHNLRTAMYVRGWTDDPTDKTPNRGGRLDKNAAMYVKDLRTRQYAAAQTKLVAYAQLEQGAFADPVLRNAVIRERAALLNSPLRWSIDPVDVIDRDYRTALEASLEGATPPTRMPNDDRGSPLSIPAAHAMLLPDGAGAGGGGGAGAAIALLAALFLLL